MHRKIEHIMGVLVLFFFALAAINPRGRFDRVYEEIRGEASHETQKRGLLIIDPGHGGRDGGKVGVNQVLEKDLNLQIGLRLKAKLEEAGFSVLMTRETDMGLYQEIDSNKKTADLKARCEFINQQKPLCTIGIHQNSFSSQAVKGAQVFYYAKSAQGRKYAEAIQKSLIQFIDSSNTRQAKPNDNYYMLLHTDTPSVIVECGFLSNWEEAQKLCSQDYQEAIAEAICKVYLENL